VNLVMAANMKTNPARDSGTKMNKATLLIRVDEQLARTARLLALHDPSMAVLE